MLTVRSGSTNSALRDDYALRVRRRANRGKMMEEANWSSNSSSWFQPGRRELPYADEVVEPGRNEWAWLRTVAGKTNSESKLLQLVRGSILSMWSIPGPYIADGLTRNGGGKELCDLLVTFGDDVIVFSDKECAFPEGGSAKVAWARWYRRAIKKSVKQLLGASNALRRHTTQVFIDAACKAPLPIALPTPDRMRVHLVAVAHGSVEAAERYWESYGGAPGSTGSLMLNTRLIGAEHELEPFQIGWPGGKDYFIHVLDSLTLALLLKELDTVADFTDYLAKKEALLKGSGCEFLIPGEEDLLAAYLTNVNEGRIHQFPRFEPGTRVVMREGSWADYKSGPLYRIRAEANAMSHLWDDLIEYQISHVIHGSAEDMFNHNGPHDTRNSERLLRLMASENRLSRRSLGATLREGRALSSNRKRWLRTIVTPENRRLFCFVFLPYFPEEQSYEEYRNYRQYLLHLYLEGALLRFPQAKELIGIAPDAYDSDRVSVDFMLGEVRMGAGITDADRIELERELRKERIWDPGSLRAGSFYDVVYRPASPTPVQKMGRAARRLADKMMRRGSRKRGPDGR
jgi:hypothetical protein